MATSISSSVLIQIGMWLRVVTIYEQCLEFTFCKNRGTYQECELKHPAVQTWCWLQSSCSCECLISDSDEKLTLNLQTMPGLNKESRPQQSSETIWQYTMYLEKKSLICKWHSFNHLVTLFFSGNHFVTAPVSCCRNGQRSCYSPEPRLSGGHHARGAPSQKWRALERWSYQMPRAAKCQDLPSVVRQCSGYISWSAPRSFVFFFFRGESAPRSWVHAKILIRVNLWGSFG